MGTRFFAGLLAVMTSVLAVEVSPAIAASCELIGNSNYMRIDPDETSWKLIVDDVVYESDKMDVFQKAKKRKNIIDFSDRSNITMTPLDGEETRVSGVLQGTIKADKRSGSLTFHDRTNDRSYDIEDVENGPKIKCG